MPELATISTRFEVVRLLGEGGMGVVYEAIDREHDVRVALKTLRRFTPDGLARFKREFRALEGMHHRNLVHLGELIVERGQWFFTMELVEGVDFLRYVRPWQRPLGGQQPPPVSGLISTARVETVDSPEQVALPEVIPAPPPRTSRELPSFDETRLREALLELALGLVVLHEAGCVHRDVKPSNIRVQADGRVVLLDFGVVGEMTTELSPGEDGVAGTPGYIAPEQAMYGVVAPSADWYSVGVILYEALTGRLPFDGGSLSILKQKQLFTPRHPSSFVRDLPQDLEELCLDLLRLEPELRPTGEEVVRRLNGPTSSAPRSVVPASSLSQASRLIGRREELQKLRDAFAASTGKALAVIVYGVSGIGKTLLVRELTRQLAAEHEEVVLLGGRCHEREEVPYKGLDDLIDQLGRRLGRMTDATVAALRPPHLGALLRVFPVLRRVDALVTGVDANADPSALEPRELRRRAFIALRELFAKLARRRRIVAVVDDLHWADADSLALLGELLRPPDPPPIFFIATARALADAPGVSGAPRDLVSAIPCEARLLLVEPLPEDDARTLAAHLIARSGASDPALAATIAAEGAGHPLFIDEIARHAAGGEATASLKLDDALRTRIARLDESARRLLEITAVAGLPTPQQVVAEAAALEPAELVSQVSVLRAGHLVRTGGPRHHDAIEPYHDRVRESVVAHLSPATRVVHHRRLALALENANSRDVEALAVHWREAGNRVRAGEYTVRAAHQAAASLAFDRAARLYRLAAELRPDDARSLNMSLAEMLTNGGRYEEAARVRLALAVDAEPTEALDLRRRAAEQFICCGHFDEGVALLRETFAALSIRFPESRFATILALLFYQLVLRVRGAAFTVREQPALDRRELVRVDAVRSAGIGLGMSDHVRGAYFQTRALLLSLRAGEPRRIVHAMCMATCGSSARGLGSAARTERLLHASERVAQSVGTDEARALIALAAGHVRYYSFHDWRGARQELERSEALFRDRCLGVSFELNSARFVLYRALAQLGDFVALAERAPSVLREVDELGDRYSMINLRVGAMTLLGLAADEPARVDAELSEAERWLARAGFHVQHFFALLARAQVELYREQPALAMRAMREKWPALASSMLLRVQMVRILGFDLRARCAVAAARVAGAPREELVALAEADARQLDVEHASVADACAHVIRGAIASIRGDAAAARVHLAASAGGFATAGMQLHAAAVRYRRGVLDGGDEGAARVREADAWMKSQRIAAPAKMAGLLAPTF